MNTWHTPLRWAGLQFYVCAADSLPAVLTFRPPQSSISVYRALKHAREVIAMLDRGDEDADAVQVALDDLELMMGAVR